MMFKVRGDPLDVTVSKMEADLDAVSGAFDSLGSFPAICDSRGDEGVLVSDLLPSTGERERLANFNLGALRRSDNCCPMGDCLEGFLPSEGDARESSLLDARRSLASRPNLLVGLCLS